MPIVGTFACSDGSVLLIENPSRTIWPQQGQVILTGMPRAELSSAQRAAAIKRRKEIWEAMQPEVTGRIPPTSGGRGNVGFAEDTERATGEAKRRTNEHLSRAETLGPDIHAVVGTSLDKAGELGQPNGARRRHEGGH